MNFANDTHIYNFYANNASHICLWVWFTQPSRGPCNF